MAGMLQTPVLISSLKIWTDSDADATSESSIAGGSCVIHGIYIDNTANSSAVYLKLYNHAAPTVGTTAPSIVIPCAGGQEVSVWSTEGTTLATDLSVACVTTAGTAGTTAPTNNVIAKIAYV